MGAANILVIEDDEIVARTIERSLRSDDYRVTLANSGVDGLKHARRRVPDLIILDVIMPGMDGYTVCREMRCDPRLASIPILFLTAKSKDDDKIAGFEAGADDYLTKPFNIDELILRVRAILRRAGALPDTGMSDHQNGNSYPERISMRTRKVLEEIQNRNQKVEADQCLIIGDYVLNSRSFELYTPERGKVQLTPVQYDLLYHLMNHPGQVFSPARLLDEVWDYPSDAGSPDLVRVHIKNLRKRVETNPRKPAFIRTVPGYGYMVCTTER